MAKVFRATHYLSSVERGDRNISICSIPRIAIALWAGMEALVAKAPPEENA